MEPLIYISSDIMAEALQFFFKYERFPAFFKLLSSAAEMSYSTNDILFSSLFYMNDEQIPRDSKIKIAEFYSHTFLQKKIDMNLQFRIKKFESESVPREYSPRTGYMFYPHLFKNICEATGVDFIHELLDFFNPEERKNLAKINSDLLPYVVDLFIMYLRTPKTSDLSHPVRWHIITNPRSFANYGKALEFFNINFTLDNTDQKFDCIRMTPQEFLFAWSEKLFPSISVDPKSVQLYANLDLVESQETSRTSFLPNNINDYHPSPPKVKFGSGTELSQFSIAGVKIDELSFRFASLKYEEAMGLFINFLKTEDRNMHRFYEKNDKAPLLFFITPAIYRTFAQFWELSPHRISPILMQLGSSKYIRFAILREISELVPFRFRAYFHSIFNPIYLEPCPDSEMFELDKKSRKNKTELQRWMAEECIKRYHNFIKDYNSFSRSEQIELGVPSGIIGNYKEEEMSSLIHSVQYAILYAFEVFKLDRGSVELQDNTHFAFSRLPFEKFRKKFVSYIPQSKPLNPAIDTLEKVDDEIEYHKWHHYMNMNIRTYKALMEYSESKGNTIDYYRKIPEMVTQSIQATIAHPISEIENAKPESRSILKGIKQGLKDFASQFDVEFEPHWKTTEEILQNLSDFPKFVTDLVIRAVIEKYHALKPKLPQICELIASYVRPDLYVYPSTGYAIARIIIEALLPEKGGIKYHFYKDCIRDGYDTDAYKREAIKYAHLKELFREKIQSAPLSNAELLKQFIIPAAPIRVMLGEGEQVSAYIDPSSPYSYLLTDLQVSPSVGIAIQNIEYKKPKIVQFGTAFFRPGSLWGYELILGSDLLAQFAQMYPSVKLELISIPRHPEDADEEIRERVNNVQFELFQKYRLREVKLAEYDPILNTVAITIDIEGSSASQEEVDRFIRERFGGYDVTIKFLGQEALDDLSSEEEEQDIEVYMAKSIAGRPDNVYFSYKIGSGNVFDEIKHDAKKKTNPEKIDINKFYTSGLKEFAANKEIDYIQLWNAFSASLEIIKQFVKQKGKFNRTRTEAFLTTLYYRLQDILFEKASLEWEAKGKSASDLVDKIKIQKENLDFITLTTKNFINSVFNLDAAELEESNKDAKGTISRLIRNLNYAILLCKKCNKLMHKFNIMDTFALVRDEFVPIVLDPLYSLRAALSKGIDENTLTSVTLYPRILKEVLWPEKIADPKAKEDRESKDKESSATDVFVTINDENDENFENDEGSEEEAVQVVEGTTTIKEIAANLTQLFERVGGNLRNKANLESVNKQINSLFDMMINGNILPPAAGANEFHTQIRTSALKILGSSLKRIVTLRGLRKDMFGILVDIAQYLDNFLDEQSNISIKHPDISGEINDAVNIEDLCSIIKELSKNVKKADGPIMEFTSKRERYLSQKAILTRIFSELSNLQTQLNRLSMKVTDGDGKKVIQTAIQKIQGLNAFNKGILAVTPQSMNIETRLISQFIKDVSELMEGIDKTIIESQFIQGQSGQLTPFETYELEFLNRINTNKPKILSITEEKELKTIAALKAKRYILSYPSDKPQADQNYILSKAGRNRIKGLKFKTTLMKVDSLHIATVRLANLVKMLSNIGESVYSSNMENRKLRYYINYLKICVQIYHNYIPSMLSLDQILHPPSSLTVSKPSAISGGLPAPVNAENMEFGQIAKYPYYISDVKGSTKEQIKVSFNLTPPKNMGLLRQTLFGNLKVMQDYINDELKDMLHENCVKFSNVISKLEKQAEKDPAHPEVPFEVEIEGVKKSHLASDILFHLKIPEAIAVMKAYSNDFNEIDDRIAKYLSRYRNTELRKYCSYRLDSLKKIQSDIIDAFEIFTDLVGKETIEIIDSKGNSKKYTAKTLLYSEAIKEAKKILKKYFNQFKKEEAEENEDESDDAKKNVYIIGEKTIEFNAEDIIKYLKRFQVNDKQLTYSGCVYDVLGGGLENSNKMQLHMFVPHKPMSGEKTKPVYFSVLYKVYNLAKNSTLLEILQELSNARVNFKGLKENSKKGLSNFADKLGIYLSRFPEAGISDDELDNLRKIKDKVDNVLATFRDESPITGGFKEEISQIIISFVDFCKNRFPVVVGNFSVATDNMQSPLFNLIDEVKLNGKKMKEETLQCGTDSVAGNHYVMYIYDSVYGYDYPSISGSKAPSGDVDELANCYNDPAILKLFRINGERTADTKIIQERLDKIVPYLADSSDEGSFQEDVVFDPSGIIGRIPVLNKIFGDFHNGTVKMKAKGSPNGLINYRNYRLRNAMDFLFNPKARKNLETSDARFISYPQIMLDHSGAFSTIFRVKMPIVFGKDTQDELQINIGIDPGVRSSITSGLTVMYPNQIPYQASFESNSDGDFEQILEQRVISESDFDNFRKILNIELGDQARESVWKGKDQLQNIGVDAKVAQLHKKIEKMYQKARLLQSTVTSNLSREDYEAEEGQFKKPVFDTRLINVITLRKMKNLDAIYQKIQNMHDAVAKRNYSGFKRMLGIADTDLRKSVIDGAGKPKSPSNPIKFRIEFSGESSGSDSGKVQNRKNTTWERGMSRRLILNYCKAQEKYTYVPVPSYYTSQRCSNCGCEDTRGYIEKSGGVFIFKESGGGDVCHCTNPECIFAKRFKEFLDSLNVMSKLMEEGTISAPVLIFMENNEIRLDMEATFIEFFDKYHPGLPAKESDVLKKVFEGLLIYNRDRNAAWNMARASNYEIYQYNTIVKLLRTMGHKWQDEKQWQASVEKGVTIVKNKYDTWIAARKAKSEAIIDRSVKELIAKETDLIEKEAAEVNKRLSIIKEFAFNRSTDKKSAGKKSTGGKKGDVPKWESTVISGKNQQRLWIDVRKAIMVRPSNPVDPGGGDSSNPVDPGGGLDSSP